MIIENIEQLDDHISKPSPLVVETLGRLEGDIIVLGAGGKMGPSLARMAKRASAEAGTKRRVIGVSRFSSPAEESKLREAGVETIHCDLLDSSAVRKLPDAPNVVFMAGMKFGTTGQQAFTWAINSYLPGVVCEKYRSSRIAAFSTGNVYGLIPLERDGSLETDELNPTGEYAMSALGRERVFEYFSLAHNVSVSIIRLNYSVELRYGVLVDVARKIFTGEPVDVNMGYANVIWQADANGMALMSLEQASSPAFVVNVTGPEILSIRKLAECFGELMGKEVTVTGKEASDALLSNAKKSYDLWGMPEVGTEQMTEWIADWVMRGGESLGKPTHFEARDGKF